jgi:hypothetical protein
LTGKGRCVVSDRVGRWLGPHSPTTLGKPHPHRVWLFYVHGEDNEEKGEGGGQNKSDFSSQL